MKKNKKKTEEKLNKINGLKKYMAKNKKEICIKNIKLVLLIPFELDFIIFFVSVSINFSQ